MDQHLMPILAGVAFGTFSRWFMLRVDYRNYPGYPHGVVTHLSLGFIASFLGAVAVPALVEREFTAVTFLALAAQQFRDVREMERETLGRLEELTLVRRGPEYVEGIARVFEARNYLAMLVALVTSGFWTLMHPTGGVTAGILAGVLAGSLMRGSRVGQIADVRPGTLWFDGANLYVDDVYLMNVGLPEARESIRRWGLGLILEPRDDDARDTLANVGQRQAILHDAVRVIGTRKDVATPEFTPLARRHEDTGRVGLVIVAMEKDMGSLIETVRRVPVLESARGTALHTRAGRRAAD